MNKILFYIFTILCVISFSHAQIIQSFGIKAGVSQANQMYDYAADYILDDEEFNYRTGVSAGIFVEFFDFQFFNIVGDAYYNQKGMKDKIELNYVYNTPSGYKSEIIHLNNRLDYLTLSTSAKFRYETHEFSPYLLTGLKYDILIAKKIDRSLENLFERRLAYNNFYDVYDGNLLGLIAGAGIETTYLCNMPMLLEFIYHYDITRVKINEYLKIRNLAIEIKIGIKLK